MGILNRGMNKSKEEIEYYHSIKKERTKIANMVARKPEIRKICCICGEDNSLILHNKDNPYFISFICRNCRDNPENLKKAEECRFDIRTMMDKSTLSSKNFTDSDVKKIVDDFLNDIVSIGAYCDKIGISRHQFNQLVDRYAMIFEIKNIKKTVNAHTNKVNRLRLSELATERNNI